ncbi:MAG: zinc ribbon domain-containing protein [Promethearchaeota archaeon]
MRYKSGVITLSMFIMVLSSVIIYNGTILKQDNSNLTLNPEDNKISYPKSSLLSNFSEAFQVSNSSVALEPDIDIDKDNNIHIVWSDQIDGDYDILYREFYYANQSWSQVINLSSSSNDQKSPVISVDEYSNIWVVWQDYDGVYYSIKGRFYNNSEERWLNTISIASGSSSSSYYHPAIDNSTGGNFTVAYDVTDISGDSYIKYKHFNHETGLWGPEHSVIASAVEDQYPDIYYDQNNKGHLVFRRKITQNNVYSILYLNRTWNPLHNDYEFGIDGTYCNITSLLEPNSTYQADKPTVIADGTTKIYVTWQDEINSSTAISQIRYTSLELTNTIDEQVILTDKVYNLTSGSDNKYNPVLAFGNNETAINPSFLWTSEQLNGQVRLKKDPYQTDVMFNQDSNNFVSAATRPHMVADSHGSLYAVYSAKKDGSSNYQIWYRYYDTWGPQLEFLTPINGTITRGNMNLTVNTEPDTVRVSYEYYLDDNFNGIADDGNTWVLIDNITSSSNNFNTVWNTTENGIKDYQHLLIRANAVDKVGIEQVIIKGNITVDNTAPQYVELVNITDSLGHYAPNSVGSTVYLGRILYFNFNVSDNCSGISYVELLKVGDSVPLASNKTSGNSTTIILNTTDASLDGLYNNLYIRAYDRANNYNDSSVFQRVISIDNIKPTASFTNPIENKEYSGLLDINLTAYDKNLYSINYYYYETGTTSEKFIGTASYIHENWTYTWDTSSLNGNYTIKASVKDIIGWETNISINISIDNTPPSPIIISPYQFQEIGLYVNITVQTDLDTVKVEFYNSSNASASLNEYDLFNSSTFYTESNGFRYFTAFFDAYSLPSKSEEYFIVVAYDNQGLSNASAKRRVEITDKYPRELNLGSLTAKYLKDPVNGWYNITLTWQSPLNEWNITKYFIYRVAIDPTIFNVEKLNEMTPAEKFEYLGKIKGEKYCVYIMEVEQIFNKTTQTYTWTDTGLYPSLYYYMIIAVNIYGNPSNCSDVIKVEIPPENPTKKINLSEVEMLPLLLLIYVAILSVFTAVNIKSSKSKMMRKEARKKLEEMYEEKFSTTGEKSLEERLDEMEMIAEEKAAKSVKGKKGKTEEIKAAPKLTKEDRFLEMKISDEREKSSESTTGPRRCPYCGWIISSKAIKCPRCGKDLL